MNTRLTLTIQRKVIEDAKKYARARGLSLSGIIENYLKAITTDVIKSESAKTPVVKSLKGSFKAPFELDYKNELVKTLNKKYR